MKKLWIPLLLLLALLVSCAPQTPSLPATSLPQSAEPSAEPTEQKTTSQPPLSTEETAEKTAEKTEDKTAEEEAVNPASLLTLSQRIYLKEYFPSLDGSTSLIPYEVSLRSAFFRTDYKSAEKQVSHSTTWGSFEKLIAGEVDMIFTCPMSEEQRTVIRESKKDLKELPVAMEAFVFVVNADNPVDSLTQQQLRDIYSGKITNWKEVGGKDQPIIAYQRNRDSGSQNFMIDFMGETPLMDPPKAWLTTTMGMLMDVLAVNDNAVNSIGYSVYSYAADMYENSSLTKFIKVDGVSPNRQTMNDRSYPLLGYNYAVYENTVSPQSPTALLAKYLLSPEAQLAAAKAGYVPVTTVDYDFSLPAEQKAKEYQGVGTGEKAPASPSYDYYTVSGSSTEELLAALNNRTLAAELENHRQKLAPQNNGRLPNLTVYNGYACFGDFGKGFDVKVWDLYTGKQLSFEELFCEGVDVDQTLNALVNHLLYKTDGAVYQSPVGEQYEPYLATDQNAEWTMGFQWISQEVGKLKNEQEVRYDRLFSDPVLVFQRERDMKGIFKENVSVVRYEIVSYPWRDPSEVPDQGSVIYLLPEDCSPHAAAINEAVCRIIAEQFQEEDVLRESLKIRPYFEIFGAPTWERRHYRGRLVIFRNGMYAYHSVMPSLFFDLESGKQLSWEELFREGWREALSAEERACFELPEAKVSGATPDSITLRYRNPDKTSEDLTISIPEAYQKY